MPIWSENPIEQEYRSAYIISGIEAIQRVWISRGCVESIDEVVAIDCPLTITPAAYAILAIHNSAGSNPDYTNIVIIDTNGNKYITGSPTFTNKFLDIWVEMYDENELFDIEVYKKDSKNYKGKTFLSCSVI